MIIFAKKTRTENGFKMKRYNPVVNFIKNVNHFVKQNEDTFYALSCAALFGAAIVLAIAIGDICLGA